MTEQGLLRLRELEEENQRLRGKIPAGCPVNLFNCIRRPPHRNSCRQKKQQDPFADLLFFSCDQRHIKLCELPKVSGSILILREPRPHPF